MQSFAEEITGASSLKEDLRTLDRVNHAAIASLRTGATHENIDTTFQTAATSLE